MDVLHHKAFPVPIELGISVVSANVDMNWLMLLGEEQEDETYCLNNSGIINLFSKISNKNETRKRRWNYSPLLLRHGGLQVSLFQSREVK